MVGDLFADHEVDAPGVQLRAASRGYRSTDDRFVDARRRDGDGRGVAPLCLFVADRGEVDTAFVGREFTQLGAIDRHRSGPHRVVGNQIVSDDDDIAAIAGEIGGGLAIDGAFAGARIVDA